MSVPTFSLSVYLEMVFPMIMPRQLSGAHTHLYTKESLAWMEKEFGMKSISTWWFGTDIVDMYRSFSVSLANNPDCQEMVSSWQRLFEPLIDDLQLVIDKERLSSEVHALYKLEV